MATTTTRTTTAMGQLGAAADAACDRARARVPRRVKGDLLAYLADRWGGLAGLAASGQDTAAEQLEGVALNWLDRHGY